MLDEIQRQKFDHEWDNWLRGYSDRGILYKAKTENGAWSLKDALLSIRRMAEAYAELHNAGCASQSVFQIVIDLMSENGDLAAVKGESEAEPQPFTLTAEEYRRLPVRTVMTRYRGEPEFKAAVDLLIRNGEI